MKTWTARCLPWQVLKTGSALDAASPLVKTEPKLIIEVLSPRHGGL